MIPLLNFLTHFSLTIYLANEFSKPIEVSNKFFFLVQVLMQLHYDIVHNRLSSSFKTSSYLTSTEALKILSWARKCKFILRLIKQLRYHQIGYLSNLVTQLVMNEVTLTVFKFISVSRTIAGKIPQQTKRVGSNDFKAQNRIIE